MGKAMEVSEVLQALALLPFMLFIAWLAIRRRDRQGAIMLIHVSSGGRRATGWGTAVINGPAH